MAGRYWHHLQLIDKLESDEDEEIGKLECESDEDEEVDKLESDEDEEVGKLQSESDEDEEVDKLESDEDEEEVSCWLCGKSVLGSRGYKCGECTDFLIHESCPKTTEATHGLTSIHHLISMKEVEKNGDEKKVVVCSLCHEPVSSNLLMLGNNNNINNNGPTFYYKCCFPNCTFLLHQPCAQLPYIIPTHPLHFSDHELFLRNPVKTQFCCCACGKVFSGHFYYKCRRCYYRLHIKCASHWLNISVDKCNPHTLSPIRDLLEFTCKACGVKRSDFAYHCSNCLIFIHSTCAQFLGTIKIRGHAHSLTCTFSLNQVKRHKCEVCYEEVDTNYAAYCCSDLKCDYIAHLRCAYWIRKECEASDSIDYVTHLVEGNDLKDDEKAAPQELEHWSHPQHKLILKNEELQNVKTCEGCMQFIVLSPFYGCDQCYFSLHIRCTKLPQEVMRLLRHEHPLTLHNANSNVRSFCCWACDKTRSGFSYKCAKDCNDAIFDAQCILIPEVFKHRGHHHILYLGRFYEEQCNACGQIPDRALTFDCTTCGFRLCINCATLPLVTRHRYDTHLLHLTYAAEDDSGEYYCQICEKERNKKLWFYYCKKCDFTAHPQCIL